MVEHAITELESAHVPQDSLDSSVSRLAPMEDTAAIVRASAHVRTGPCWTVSPENVCVDSVERGRAANVSAMRVVSDQTACTHVNVMNMVLAVIPLPAAAIVQMDGMVLGAAWPVPKDGMALTAVSNADVSMAVSVILSMDNVYVSRDMEDSSVNASVMPVHTALTAHPNVTVTETLTVIHSPATVTVPRDGKALIASTNVVVVDMALAVCWPATVLTVQPAIQ
jgi:hypothetical protein